MGEVLRAGIFYPDFGQIAVNNTSLQRKPSPYISVRMKGLSQIGHDSDTLIYGDELTWDDLEVLRIPWGYSEIIKYETLQPNYRYVWNVGTSTFSITDASGNSISYRNTKNISDLGISLAIIESHQFIILLTASYDWDAFFIAKKIDPRSLSEKISYIWGQSDEYIKGATHFLPGAMINVADPQTGNTPVGIHQNFHMRGRELLLSKALELYATGNYPNNILIQKHDKIANRPHVEHNGVKNDLGKLLMIHMFTQNKLHGTFPNSFPWMLYQSFKWLWDDDQDGKPYDPNGPGEARIYDRTFDLSPWWG